MKYEVVLNFTKYLEFLDLFFSRMQIVHSLVGKKLLCALIERIAGKARTDVSPDK